MTDSVANTPLCQDKADAVQKVFGTSLFGFKRAEVLDYIDRFAASSAGELAKSIALYDTASQQLKQATEDNVALEAKLETANGQINTQSITIDTQSSEIADMRIMLDKKSDQADAFKSRLFSREQENSALKADNSRLNATINSLTITVNEYYVRKDEIKVQEQNAKAEADKILQDAGGRALATKRDAQIEAETARNQILADARLTMENADEEAQRILDKAGDDAVEMLAQAARERDTTKVLLTGSCEDIADSVETLKRELSVVESKITEASYQLQNAAKGIATALENTEKNLDILGVQAKHLPNSAPSVRAVRETAASVAAFAPHDKARPMSRGERTRRSVADGILERLGRILG